MVNALLVEIKVNLISRTSPCCAEHTVHLIDNRPSEHTQPSTVGTVSAISYIYGAQRNTQNFQLPQELIDVHHSGE